MLDASLVQFHRRQGINEKDEPITVHRGVLAMSCEHEMTDAEIADTGLSKAEFEDGTQIYLTKMLMTELYGEFLPTLESALWQVESLNPISQTKRTEAVINDLKAKIQGIRNRT